MTVGDGLRSDEGRKTLNHRASEWRPGELVHELVSRRDQCKPEAPAEASTEVVRESREILDERLGLAPARSGDPVTQHAIRTGFVDKHVVLIGRDGHTVGKIESG